MGKYLLMGMIGLYILGTVPIVSAEVVGDVGANISIEEINTQAQSRKLVDNGNMQLVLDQVYKRVGVYKNQEEFIQLLASHRNEAIKKGIFPSVMIGQAMLESGVDGSSDLARLAYNLYGIKGAYKGESANFSTLEDASIGDYFEVVAGFKVYPTYQESIMDYLELIGDTDLYKKVPTAKTNYEQLQYIKDAGYATDGLYVEKVMSVIELYALDQYDKGMR